jgi:DNA-binding GntR family transcriptional regulator
MEQPNKTDQAYVEIRKQILSRALEPGERLVERTWAEKLSVNRADVRQAFSRLLGEGLIETGLKGGAFIANPDPERESEYLRARMALEIGAGYLAIDNATPDDIAELEQIVELMQTLADRKMYAGFCEADMHFHEVLVRSAHSPRLMDIYQRANFPLTLSPSQPKREELLQRDTQRHCVLLEALKQRDFTLLTKRLSDCYES